ncbi:DNA-3-methyladenine glycosylase [Streptomyces sp. WMMC940]|uniref:DNA-3-methyladenine glycosylase n=1 Tax=Streptomyces sp. WMMC940 TaxID=3015153 RepID=UPI0022B63450|nr:DNA-3-methyladenine glycosylase [Streptomyces sp. WMMC940]MCZ7461148.1 DNA-3-methyladenine glycosylase [Streptomyces sp. WMMC940]
MRGPEGTANGALLRAGEILASEELAFERRLSARNSQELAKGPAGDGPRHRPAPRLRGRLLRRGRPLTLLLGTPPVRDQARNGRAPATAGTERLPWRYWIDGGPTASPYRPHSPRSGTT